LRTASSVDPRAPLAAVVIALVALLSAMSAAAETPTETPHVAVLPFQAPDAPDLDPMRDELADAIRERLAASGRARIVDAAPHIERVGLDGIRGAS